MTYTYDTRVLIALERRKQRALELYARANERGEMITVPSIVEAKGNTPGRTELEGRTRLPDLAARGG